MKCESIRRAANGTTCYCPACNLKKLLAAKSRSEFQICHSPLLQKPSFFKPMPIIVSTALKGAFVDNNSRETPVVFGCSSNDQTPRCHSVRHRQVWGQVWKSTWFIQTHCKYVVITELQYISVVYYTRWFLQHGLLLPETATSGTADMWLLMGGKNSSMFILCQFW